MASDNLEDNEKEIPLSGIPLAKRFYEIAQKEYQNDVIERMRESYEKANRGYGSTSIYAHKLLLGDCRTDKFTLSCLDLIIW